MDVLATIDPVLVIPVVCTVALAFLVYLFGFQKTQEPSFQQLAVLQSAGKTRSQFRQQVAASGKAGGSNGTAGNVKKEKVIANGHAAPVASGVPKSSPTPGSTGRAADKENQKPATPKAVAVKKEKKVIPVKDEDYDEGDWTSVSRKDKKAKDKVQQPKKADKRSNSPIVPTTAANNPTNISDSEMLSIEEVMKIASAAKAAVNLKGLKEIVEKEPEPVIEKVEQVAETKSSAKKTKAKAPATPPPVAKAKVQPVAPEIEEQKEKVKIVVEDEAVEEEPAAMVITNNKKNAKEAPVETNNNIAFDEMGDLWEEAKSRGNKKKARARRD